MTTMLELACVPVFSGDLGGKLLSNDWLMLSLLALLISTLALSILYIFASFLRNPQLLGWAKFELFQVFGTAVIIFFFAMTLYGICAFDMSFLDSQRYYAGENMYEIIANYFEKLETAGYLIYGYIMYVTKIFAFLSKVTVLSHPMGVGSQESPLESLGQLNSLVFFMLSGFITSFLLLQLQMRMLDYLAFACLGYLFPLGIFFRCFEPTRSFGGTLLGIAVSLFLFYPVIMVFNDYLMYSQIDDLMEDAKGANAAANTAIVSGAMPSPVSIVGEGTSPNSDPNNPNNPSQFFEGVTGGIFFFIKPIMVYFIAAVMLPVINFIVLVEITRGTTAFLGDEIDVSNLTRLI